MIFAVLQLKNIISSPFKYFSRVIMFTSNDYGGDDIYTQRQTNFNSVRYLSIFSDVPIGISAEWQWVMFDFFKAGQ